MKEHILTLSEPYRSVALAAIASRGKAQDEKFRTLHNALVWALPPGELKRNSFWAGVLNSERTVQKVHKSKTYTKIENNNNWKPEPREEIEASTDGRLCAKRTFISCNPTRIGDRYIVNDKHAHLQFCHLLRKSRPSPFNRHG